VKQGDSSRCPIKKVLGNKQQLICSGAHHHLHRAVDLNLLVENVIAMNKGTEIYETLVRMFI